MRRNEKNYSHPKSISSNQLFINYSSKNVVLMKFLPKRRESKFPACPQFALRAYFVIKIQLFNFLTEKIVPVLNLTE